METKLRPMRHRDVWHVVNCDSSGLEKAGGGSFVSTAKDIEFYLRQQFHMLAVASDCHDTPRGYMHADCGTKSNFAILRRLVVHADWWRMGIGGQLMNGLLIQCRNAQVDIHCDVPFAMLPESANFLKHHGFHGTGLYSFNDDDYARMHWSSTVQAGAA